jgi:CheY-like chemotaxis protein
MYPLKSGPAHRDGDGGSSRILHILVVEDHTDTRRGMELFLQALGHWTQVAVGMQAALDLAARSDTRFDLLLSDLRLPDGNGWDLLLRLEEAGCRPQRAIAISGWSSESDMAKSKSAGFQWHLVKPVNPNTLEAVLVKAAEEIKNLLTQKPTHPRGGDDPKIETRSQPRELARESCSKIFTCHDTH